MKAILKSLLPELTPKYDEIFTSETNTLSADRMPIGYQLTRAR